MIKGYVDGQKLCIEDLFIVSDTINYITAEFEFDNDWNNCVKYAHFVQDDIHVAVELTDNKIREENGLNLTAGVWLVHIHGEQRDEENNVIKRITTDVQYLHVQQSGVENGDPLPLQPKGESERLWKTVGELEAAVDELAKKGGAVKSVNDKTGEVLLNAKDVGALPDDTVIPSKTSELENDSGFIENFTETDPTVPSWAKQPTKPQYTPGEIGAEVAGTASNLVSAHNTEKETHGDIRLLISELTSRLNALADSDDTTLDQLSEIVAYIKSNKSLLYEVMTNKVSYTDIIDNLITNVADKPLSAAQGVVLKALIDGLTANKADLIDGRVPKILLPEELWFQGDWEENDETSRAHIKGRTHYKYSLFPTMEYTLNSDGSYVPVDETKDFVLMEDADSGQIIKMVFVSDRVLTKEEISSSTIRMATVESGELSYDEQAMSDMDDMFISIGNSSIGVGSDGMYYLMSVSEEDAQSGMDGTLTGIPQYKGTYLLYFNMVETVGAINRMFSFAVKRVPDEYLPERAYTVPDMQENDSSKPSYIKNRYQYNQSYDLSIGYTTATDKVYLNDEQTEYLYWVGTVDNYSGIYNLQLFEYSVSNGYASLITGLIDINKSHKIRKGTTAAIYQSYSGTGSVRYNYESKSVTFPKAGLYVYHNKANNTSEYYNRCVLNTVYNNFAPNFNNGDKNSVLNNPFCYKTFTVSEQDYGVENAVWTYPITEDNYDYSVRLIAKDENDIPNGSYIEMKCNINDVETTLTGTVKNGNCIFKDDSNRIRFIYITKNSVSYNNVRILSSVYFNFPYAGFYMFSYDALESEADTAINYPTSSSSCYPITIYKVMNGVEATYNKGVAGGYASLDENAAVPLEQLPITNLIYDGAIGIPTAQDVYDYVQNSGIAAFSYKGAKDNYSDLPTDDNKIGDVWNIINADEANGVDAGDNACWNGNGWDILSGVVDLSDYSTTEQIVDILNDYAMKNEVPTKTSQLENDSGFLTQHQDLSDYAKSEMLEDVKNSIPTQTSQLKNNSGFIIAETDPTVPSWAKQSTKPTYTPSEVGADAAGTASTVVSDHNTDTSAHNDIRVTLANLKTKIEAFLNTDDTTLDQLNEIVEYIKNNKTLIDSITTSKVNVSDIVDNLTTNVSNKPLSAAMGVALKALIDAIVLPTKVSQLSNDKGYLTAVPGEYVTETELNAKGYATTAQIPGSLPANGGNADTVDNYHVRKASKDGFVTNGTGWIEFVV